jgi:hypothetical protein
VLFSETVLEPISYRRAILLLKCLRHLAGLGEDLPVKNGLIDSLELEQQSKMSWVNDIVMVLSQPSIPAY